MLVIKTDTKSRSIDHAREWDWTRRTQKNSHSYDKLELTNKQKSSCFVLQMAGNVLGKRSLLWSRNTEENSLEAQISF